MTDSETLLGERVLSARKGPGGIQRKILGRLGRSVAQGDWIFRGDGQPVGSVRPAFAGGMLGAVKQVVKPVTGKRSEAIWAAAGEMVVDILDRSESMVLRVFQTGNYIRVLDPSGEELGEIVRTGPTRQTDLIRFYAGDPDRPKESDWKSFGWKNLEHLQVGYVLPEPYDKGSWFLPVEHEIADCDGTPVARGVRDIVDSPYGKARVTKLGPIEEPLNSLLVAYVWALGATDWQSSLYRSTAALG